jgi:hypothetical protein
MFEFLDLTLLISTLFTIGFSWSFIKNPKFQRCVIAKIFNTYDYFYEKFYKLWYDDKVRTNVIKTIDSKNINSVLLKSTNLEKEEKEKGKECMSENSKLLFEFLSNEIKFECVTIKEKKYYLIGTNPIFTKDNILECPWLAISIQLILHEKEEEPLTIDVSEKFMEFWIEGNELPIHLEYYDYWIRKLLTDSGCSNFKIYEKEEIKELKLVIINELGDSIEYQNILVIPKKDTVNTIEFQFN